MKRLCIAVALLCAAISFGAISCASNQSGPIQLGDGKLFGGIPVQLGDGKAGSLDMCRAANLVLAGATIYGEATGDPRVTGAMAFAPGAFALMGCDPATSSIELSPEQCQGIANVIAAYRLSGKGSASADMWVDRLLPRLCPSTVIPNLPPVPKHDGEGEHTTPTPTHGDGHHEFPTLTPTPHDGHGSGGHGSGEHATSTPRPIKTPHPNKTPHGGGGHGGDDHGHEGNGHATATPHGGSGHEADHD